MSAVLRQTPEQLAPMRAEDLAEVVGVEQQSYEFPWTQGNFVDSLRAGHSAWTLRNGRNELIGYAIFAPVLDEAHLLNLTVAPHRQRLGFGWRLLEWMAENARSYGARTMLLEVRPSNAAALAMYERYGFQRIGSRRGYYPARDGREDAVVMRAQL